MSPGSKTSHVGGRYGEAEPPVLVVRVQAPAALGKANDAAVRALARAFGAGRDRVRIVTGHSSRSKLVEIDGADDSLLDVLLGR